MSKINCKADNCYYNSRELCQKDSVQVEGRAAHEPSQTNCQSFSDKGSGPNCKSKK